MKITKLKIENFKAIKNIELDNLSREYYSSKNKDQFKNNDKA